MSGSPRVQLVSVGPLYVGAARGLMADALAAHALGAELHSVVTLIVSASQGHVTDITDVPLDTVRAQLEHLTDVVSPSGILLGALGGRGVAEAALSYADESECPVVLDLQLSGPSGETLVSQAGIDAVRARLDVPNLVILSNTDAELFSGGEITSLDDAQVAAHRVIKQGARTVLIKCGALPARFFEVESVERPDAAFNADLYFDGDEFALFEAPHLLGLDSINASSALSVPILNEMAKGYPITDSIQRGKQFVTDALRSALELGHEGTLRYFREHSS